MTSVFKGTLDNLLQGWQGMAESLRDTEKVPDLDPALSPSDAALLRRRIRGWLSGQKCEISSRRRAASIGKAYLTLAPEGKRRFLDLLAHDFASDRKAVEEGALELSRAEGEEGYLKAEKRLRDLLVSPRIRLLRQFLVLPQGVKFLIDLRADLLEHLGSDPALKSLDAELRDLLATWFDIAFLKLRHVTWNSPAALLEKLIAYEAVHEIHSWADLRNRLESDRRCYAFFHPAMPGEPLIFVEVALVNGIAGSIQTLLDQHAPDLRPEKADTAIFYSISNAQKGLRGISLGNFLIKQVVNDLRHEFPNLRTFCTLSPIPGFARWLGETLAAGGKDRLTEPAREAIGAAASLLGISPSLEDLLAHPGWFRQEEASALLRAPLERLCVRYLHERGGDGAPLDPVERFHLGNGARVERVSWLGDTSAKGVRQGCGFMVNYLYKLDDIEKNQELYDEGRIPASAAIRALLREPEGEGGRRRRMSRLLRISLFP